LRVLLTGATGLIGSAVLAALGREGHRVIAVTRSARGAKRLCAATAWVTLDMAKAIRPEDWLAHLAGIDAVVNCAGVLQDSMRDSLAGVHVAGASALFAACERAGVRRLVHLSALGIEGNPPAAFARTKLMGEECLRASRLDWVILRPSVVVGRAAYGGSAFFRGLAALPIIPSLADSARLQILQLDDLVRTVLFFLPADAPARLTLQVAGEEVLTLEEIIARYRHWLGLGPARFVRLPRPLSAALYLIGDLIGALGWRPPLRSTTRILLAHGVLGDAAPWRRLTGIAPRSLVEALRAEPASVQERWFARLYFLKPTGLIVLMTFWILSGCIALLPGRSAAVAVLRQSGLGEGGALLATAAGALADILVGLGMGLERTSRLSLRAALALSAAYGVLCTCLLPRLWLDPLGPLVKIAPIFLAHLLLLAIMDDR
jgi:uncharacterized protein YbjT (DUF2867 family)